MTGLFDNEVLFLAFKAPRLDTIFRSIAKSFHHFPSRLKRKYLYYQIERHNHGRPSVFSTLFFRAYDLQVQRRGISPEAASSPAREELLREIVDSVDLYIFTTRYSNNPWISFARGREIKHWLSIFRILFPNAYPDVNLALRLYLMLRGEWTAASGYTIQLQVLLYDPVATQYRFAFAHDAMRFAVSSRSSWISKTVCCMLDEDLKNMPLRPYIEEAAKNVEFPQDIYFTNMLLHRLMGGDATRVSVDNQLLPCIGNAIANALATGETEVSAIIIDMMSRCGSIRALHQVFHDVYGGDWTTGRTHMLTSARMKAIKEEAQLRIMTLEKSSDVQKPEPPNRFETFRLQWQRIKSRMRVI